MHDAVVLRFRETADFRSSSSAEKMTRYRVNRYSRGASPLLQLPSQRGDQLCRVSARLQAFQQQKRLVLPAAPFRLQVDEQHLHDAASSLRRVVCTSFPSLAYLRRTARAAILAMSAPR